ncbi:MAG: hypothetical protein PHV30_12150 [Candidatus Margulisbacteria bacterium]|nr:hypothetical protein [Candidatus Margulisiibacteriota bacterium]
MNFIPWLKLQARRNDSTGDLARELIANPNNDIITGYHIFVTYLTYKKAPHSTFVALANAFKEYHKEKYSQGRRAV